jgi:hypothetical protein
VEYDIDATLTHLRESGVEADALELAESALRTGGLMPGRLLKEGGEPGNGRS